MHIELSGRVGVAAPPADAFRFFTPEGERLWVPDWEPEYLHPHDGTLTDGLVFRTRHGGDVTLWLVANHQPGVAIEYVRVTPESRMGTVTVQVAPAGWNATEAQITYRMTALSAVGERLLHVFAADFPEMLAEWERRIGYALTGEVP
jgi:hypothetical protein